ncbi:MAG: hypothetical protein K0R87_2982 [Pseudonocardia sp.]|nr:hypothetical protein [Pseudonocardia sp.]
MNPPDRVAGANRARESRRTGVRERWRRSPWARGRTAGMSGLDGAVSFKGAPPAAGRDRSPCTRGGVSKARA